MTKFGYKGLLQLTGVFYNALRHLVYPTNRYIVVASYITSSGSQESNLISSGSQKSYITSSGSQASCINA